MPEAALNTPGERGATLYSNEQADQVAAFVKQHKDEVRLIILHCDAGLSRSPGMADALSRALNSDDSFYFAGGKRASMRGSSLVCSLANFRTTLGELRSFGLVTVRTQSPEIG
jgi:D-serine deaminase-like pyridoxal phosphate-dependent protein